MTYGRLWDTLIALGYTRIDAPEYIVFREEEHDALIALPIREPDTKLHFWHHSSSRSNVFGRGVASKEVFERMLTKPAVVEIAAKTGTEKANATTRTGFVRPRKQGVVTATSRTAVRKAEDAPSLQELHAEKT